MGDIQHDDSKRIEIIGGIHDNPGQGKAVPAIGGSLIFRGSDKVEGGSIFFIALHNFPEPFFILCIPVIIIPCVVIKIGKGIIKVLTGQRRVGKSCILKQLQIDILKENPQANILYINMEYEEFRGIRNDTDLFEYLRDKFQEGVDTDNYPKYVVSLDEFNRGGDVQGIQHLHLSDFLKKEVL